MNAINCKPILLVILLLCPQTSQNSEKTTYDYPAFKETIPYTIALVLAGLLFYKRNYIINKVWYSIFSPNKKTLQETCNSECLRLNSQNPIENIAHSSPTLKDEGHSIKQNKKNANIQHLPIPPIENPNTKNQEKNPLHEACYKKNYKEIARLLNHSNIDPNRQNEYEETPLHIVCGCKSSLCYQDLRNREIDEKLVKLLLNHPNINPNILDKWGQTPLHIACGRLETKVVQLLLDHPNINPNVQIKHKYNGWYSTLHYACIISNQEIVKLLLNHPNIDPNIQNNDEQTPLHIACEDTDHSIDKEIIQLLLQHPNIDPHAKDRWNQSPLHIDNINIIKLFLKHPKVNPNAVTDRYHDRYNILHEHSLLHRACKKSNKELVQLLLQHPNIDVNIQDLDNNTPLHFLCFEEGKFEGDYGEDKYRLIELLLQHPNINVNMQNNDINTEGSPYYVNGNSALHIACKAKNINAINLLLTNPTINVNIQNKWGNTPLHCLCKHKNLAITDLLNHPHSDLNITNNKGYTPLHIALLHNNIEAPQIILQHPNFQRNKHTIKANTDALITVCKKKNIQLVKLLLNNLPVIIDTKTDDGNTPLLIAAHDSKAIMNILIEYGANISIKNEAKQTAFYIGYTKKSFDTMNEFTTITADDYFFNEQLSAAAQMLTCSYEHLPYFINWCIKNGGTLHQRNKNSKLPLDIAARQFKYATQYLPQNSPDFIHKEKMYHIFLRHTPYDSDATICHILKQNNLCIDVIQNIMGYYSAITIDRHIAINIHHKNILYDYSLSKTKKNQFKKNIITQKCKQLGYINPYLKII